MILVNLLVGHLGRARAFYESLGFRTDQHSSDERSVTLVVDDSIVITLVTQDAFADFLAGEVGDPAAGTTIVNCLCVSSREEVDELVRKAEASGAATWFDEREDPAIHTGSFADPDGHVWRIIRMEQVHAID